MLICIKGGTVVTSKGTHQADVWIEDAKIKYLGNADLHADKVIEATGQYILPGGVDPHVHMSLPTPAGPSSDNFYSGSLAALQGGTTTIIDFVTPQPGQSMSKALKLRLAEAQKSQADYSFHVSPVEWRDSMPQEIAECMQQGLTSFKIYMAYKNAVGLEDDEIAKVLQTVGRLGGLVTVHAEMDDEIDAMREEAASEGRLSPAAHAATRPNHTEADAVKKIIDMADEANCPLYIVHVSTKESMEHIQEAHKRGQHVIAETCPHYLLLDKSKYEGNFEQTVKYVLSPPLRSETDKAALWKALQNGSISTVGTDHCPFMYAQKRTGIHDFRKIPNGAGGVEHRIPLLYTYGVAKQKISLEKMVDITSTQPAKIFGLYPRKGEIAPGADADIVVWEPESKHTIRVGTHHQHTDLNIYEDFETQGSITWLFKNGKIVIADSKQQLEKIAGNFLERKKVR